MNGQVEVTWRTLRTVAHALMVHARVPEVDVHFALMYTTDHIFLVLTIKDHINDYGDPTTPHKLATGTKHSVSHLCVLFCPCVVRKATAHVDTKTLNMRHQAQKGFRGIFVGIPQHQKGYLVYVSSTRKEQTGNVIMFAQFEEGNLLTETRKDTECGDEFDSESIMMSEQDMENLDEKENFDDDRISTEMLHDIRDGNQK